MKKDDPNTGDGSGKEKAEVEDPETQPGDKDKSEDKKSDDEKTKKPASKSEDKSEPVGDDDDVEEDDDDDEGLADEKQFKVSQAKLDQMIDKRLKKQARSLEKKQNSELKKRDDKIASLEKTADAYRELVSTSVQTELDQLPEKIKKMAPTQKIETASDLKKVQEWLPDAKVLAQELGVVIKTPGNPP